MKRIIINISIALILSASIKAQNPSCRAYPTGIYVFCGKEIPKNFYYLIEKKDASGQWEKAAELRAPRNAAELKANMHNLPDYFRAIMPLPFELADSLWKRQSAAPDIYSLYAYAYDPKIVSIVGCGWFDDGITANGTYQYRITRVNRSGEIVLGELSQIFPENIYKGTVNTLRYVPHPDMGIVTLYYGLSDTTSTYKIMLYRSRFMEKNFMPVSADAGFGKMNGRTVAIVRDETATKGMAYSYVAVPFDFLGNFGTPSDTVNVYNLTNMSDIGILTDFTAIADREKEGNQLSWNMNSDFYIHGYELYRSKVYDGEYQRIVTLPANVTSFFDDDIDPGEAYFYYVTVNNGFGSNLPSARTPVILEGKRDNFLPPQNIEAKLIGNVVQLTFNSIEPDTRGYQIFRGEGYMGDLTQIASMSVAAPEKTTDPNALQPMVVFNDTLALTSKPQTWSYAVADVNSSYNISPLSERVSIQFSGGMIPAPSNVEAQLRDDRIFVFWDDMKLQNPYVGGYNLLRSTVNQKGEEDNNPQLIATLSNIENSYMDSLLIPGTHYRYVVESVGINGEKSGLSMHAGIRVPTQLPLPPGQVSAIAATDRILLRWDNPIDPSIRSVRIYRAALEQQPVLLKELSADRETYEDTTAKKGEQYFYYVVTVNNRSEESRWDEPVGGRIRK